MLRPISLAVLLAAPLLSIAGLMSLAACSSSDSTTSSSSSSSSGSSGTSEAGADATDTADAADAADAAVVVNDCKNFADRSAASDSRVLTYDFSISESATDRCIIIKKGETVTWDGDFSVHPLGVQGGDTPNPIAGVGADGKVTFPNTGLYGWTCMVHPSMTGAVQVTE